VALNEPEDITIVVADDHKWFRDGLMRDLEDTPGLLPVGEAGTADEAVDLAVEAKADIILMDIEMFGTSGLEATRRLMEEVPDPPRVLILTSYDNDEYIIEAVQSGASGYLLKTIEGPELERRIRSVFSSGRQEFPDRVRQLMPRYEARRRREAEEEKLVSALSFNEIKALELIDRGFSYKEVAKRLSKSRYTIKVQLASARDKLNVGTSKEAALLARRTGRIKD
jgi:DNA-binding NarL/FixJ family response regulator